MLAAAYASAIIVTVSLAAWGAIALIIIRIAIAADAPTAGYALLAGATAGVAVAAAGALMRVWGRRNRA